MEQVQLYSSGSTKRWIFERNTYTDSLVSKRPTGKVQLSTSNPKKNQDYFTSTSPISNDDNSNEMKKFSPEFIHHVRLNSQFPCPKIPTKAVFLNFLIKN